MNVFVYSNYDLEKLLKLGIRFLDSLLQDFAILHEGAEFGCRQCRVFSFSSQREILALPPVQFAQKEYCLNSFHLTWINQVHIIQITNNMRYTLYYILKHPFWSYTVRFTHFYCTGCLLSFLAFLFHVLVGMCSFCLSGINYVNMFHFSCINHVHYIQITNNMRLVLNDVYIIKMKCILLVFCLLQKTVCLCSYHSHPLNSEIQNAWSYISTSYLINDGVIN